jgi:hypothetical protein
MGMLVSDKRAGMPPIKAVSNQFLGINPLLHSRLQLNGGWDHFHVNHISDLTRFLQRELRAMGYVALSEQSLQIRRREGTSRSPESDVTIYDSARRTHDNDTILTGGLALSVPELLQLDEADLATYRAVGIYQKAGEEPHGEAVGWLELLSPSNKPGGRHFKAYRDKRTALLQAGLVFIELDYLHHQPPTVAAPPYPDHPESSCYRIVIIDPRPDWLHGEGRVYSVHVDQTLPTLRIPLNAGDVLDFDFDAPYQQTYEGLFFGDDLDYTQLPPAWERYRADDQARILTRLLTIRQQGTAASYPPEQIEPLPLDKARQRWQSDK